MGFFLCVFFYIKCPIISALFIERTIFSWLNYLWKFSKIKWPDLYWSLSGISILYHWSIYPFANTALSYTDLYCLKIRYCGSSNFVLLFKMFWLFSILCFIIIQMYSCVINFRLSLSVSTKKISAGVLIVIAKFIDRFQKNWYFNDLLTS